MSFSMSSMGGSSMGGSSSTSWIGPMLSGTSDLMQVGAAHADYLWGKDIRKRQFAGNTYVGSNPAMAGQFSGAYADIKAKDSFYDIHKEPMVTKILDVAGPIIGMAGSVMQGQGMDQGDINNLSKGFTTFNEDTRLAKSGIRIKPENRGKFTKYCGGKVTAECIRRGKNSSSTAVRKRATFAENARGWKHAQDGMKIVGPTHEAGGVDMLINGYAIEAEGGEEVKNMPNGDVVILNKSQQRQEDMGKPLSQIIKGLPIVGRKAQTGLMIENDINQEYPAATVDATFNVSGQGTPLLKFDDAGMRYRIGHVLPDPTVKDAGMRYRDPAYIPDVPPPTSPIGTDYGFRFNDPNYKSPIPAPASPVTTDAGMRYRTGDWIKTGPDVTTPSNDYGFRFKDPNYPGIDQPHVTTPAWPTTISGKDYGHDMQVYPGEDTGDPSSGVPPANPDLDFFDQYMRDLKMSRNVGMMNNAAQFFTAYLDYLKNKKAKGPDQIPPIGAAFPAVQWISPDIPMQTLERGFVRSLRSGWEMGNRDRASEVFTRFLAGTRDIGSRYAAVNAQSAMGQSQAGANAVNAVNIGNAEIKKGNIAMNYQWEKDRSLAMKTNKDLMSKSLYANQIVNSQFYKNRLEANIYKYLANKYPEGLAYMFGHSGITGMDPEMLAYYAAAAEKQKSGQ